MNSEIKYLIYNTPQEAVLVAEGKLEKIQLPRKSRQLQLMVKTI